MKGLVSGSNGGLVEEEEAKGCESNRKNLEAFSKIRKQRNEDRSGDIFCIINGHS